MGSAISWVGVRVAVVDIVMVAVSSEVGVKMIGDVGVPAGGVGCDPLWQADRPKIAARNKRIIIYLPFISTPFPEKRTQPAGN